jgi:hypothetical protein
LSWFPSAGLIDAVQSGGVLFEASQRKNDLTD